MLHFTLQAATGEQLGMTVFDPSGALAGASIADPAPGLYLAQITELINVQGGFTLTISTTCPDSGCH